MLGFFSSSVLKFTPVAHARALSFVFCSFSSSASAASSCSCSDEQDAASPCSGESCLPIMPSGEGRCLSVVPALVTDGAAAACWGMSKLRSSRRSDESIDNAFPSLAISSMSLLGCNNSSKTRSSMFIIASSIFRGFCSLAPDIIIPPGRPRDETGSPQSLAGGAASKGKIPPPHIKRELLTLDLCTQIRSVLQRGTAARCPG